MTSIRIAVMLSAFLLPFGCTRWWIQTGRQGFNRFLQLTDLGLQIEDDRGGASFLPGDAEKHSEYAVEGIFGQEN